MSRKWMAAAWLALVLALTGCAADKNSGHSLQLFYPASEYPAGGDVIHSQAVDWTQQEKDTAAQQVMKVVELLQNRDKKMDFESPIPQGTDLLRCTVANGLATLDFSAAYGRLSGIDLTVADYCLTLSASQIPGVRRLQILVEGELLPACETLELTTDDVLLTSSEDVVKAVPVTLYFPDAGGTLQAERRELLIYEGENRCQRVMEALLEGPENEDLEKLLPDGVDVAGIWMDGDVCCLNFSYSNYRKLCEGTVDQERVVRGLTQSLCSLNEVQSLQILVDGAYRTVLGAVNIYLPISP